jgi:Mrp family chromosome partitioning ATPase
MDHIRQALERATESPGGVGSLGAPVAQTLPPATPPPRPQYGLDHTGADAEGTIAGEVELRHKQLEKERIVAHDNTDPRSRAFDMLRTQILQSMDLKEWQIIGVTSATPGCGKTHTAVNLAMSIARQRERSVLLVDMDLQKPQIATRLNIRSEEGILGVLEGQSGIANAMTRVRVGNLRLNVLPCEKPTSHSSEWMASGAMTALLRELRQADRSRIIILDLPPVLIGDDVLSILPQIDCVLFVAAVGASTVADIKECNKHLQATTVVRIALNKSSEIGPSYYGAYA